MTQKEIDKFLAYTKVYVNGKSKEIQEKLFSLGYKWCDGYTKVDYTDCPFLYIYEESKFISGNNMVNFSDNENREITAEEILSLELTEPIWNKGGLSMTSEEARKAAENINLCKILTNCPKGTKFYSKIHGDVVLYRVDYNREFLDNGIFYECPPNDEVVFIPEDKLYDRDKGEYILLPAKDQPDWRKWEYFKNPKFNPKTLQPFDKVLVRDYSSCYWNCDFFSRIDDSTSNHKCITVSSAYIFCIPYNDETKHLIGTSDEAPEFYRYWKD